MGISDVGPGLRRIGRADPNAGNSTVLYFACSDCAVEAARAADAGGRVETAKKAVGPYGFIALVIDTEGNIVGLHSMQ